MDRVKGQDERRAVRFCALSQNWKIKCRAEYHQHRDDMRQENWKQCDQAETCRGRKEEDQVG